MSKDDNKSVEVKNAEKSGGQTFDPTLVPADTTDRCSTCNGDGILSPDSTQVCQTCAGTGKA